MLFMFVSPIRLNHSRCNCCVILLDPRDCASMVVLQTDTRGSVLQLNILCCFRSTFLLFYLLVRVLKFIIEKILPEGPG